MPTPSASAFLAWCREAEGLQGMRARWPFPQKRCIDCKMLLQWDNFPACLIRAESPELCLHLLPSAVSGAAGPLGLSVSPVLP